MRSVKRQQVFWFSINLECLICMLWKYYELKCHLAILSRTLEPLMECLERAVGRAFEGFRVQFFMVRNRSNGFRIKPTPLNRKLQKTNCQSCRRSWLGTVEGETREWKSFWIRNKLRLRLLNAILCGEQKSFYVEKLQRVIEGEFNWDWKAFWEWFSRIPKWTAIWMQFRGLQRDFQWKLLNFPENSVN